jgi:hypothetical protein
MMDQIPWKPALSTLLLGALLFAVPVAFPTEPPQTVTLIQPNGGETVLAGKVFEVQWTTTATGGRITLQFSLDSGNTWTEIVQLSNPASQIGEKGAYVWLVPPVRSDHARVRVIWTPRWGPSVMDISDSDFIIRKLESIFPDVPEGFWAFPEISALTDSGVISGYPDGSFRPQNPVSRAEFAKMVVLSLGIAPNSPEKSSFGDVPLNHWACSFVEAALKAGLMKGYPDGSFHPEGEITKAEIITVLVRYKQWQLFLPQIPTFADCPVNEWYYGYLETATGYGLIPQENAEIVRKDDSGNLLFDPGLPATRAQTAFFLYRIKSG